MSQDRNTDRHLLNRRTALKAGGGALLGAAVLAAPKAAGIMGVSTAMAQAGRSCPAGAVCRRLVATDGYISLPARDDPLYIFGFSEVTPAEVFADVETLVSRYKGQVQLSAPLLATDQDVDLYLSMTNLGLVVRPDLDDAHTVHWHGFRNQIALFDGVPEVSIAVPVGRTFPYFFRPHDPGTYMYHCHFEDVEHVQMGMHGIVFVRPSQNGTSIGGHTKFAYNDGDGSTGYEREFALMLNEIDTNPHDLLENVQEFIWNEYKPNYWTINGRAYPDTLLPNDDPALPSQPISSLIQVNEGDHVLLRFANLGYEQHAMILPGIPMKVVGHDATLMRGPGGADISYFTNTVYIGPGEARDVLFVAPPHRGPRAFNAYPLRNHSPHKLTNNGARGLGGMATEVRVYPAGTLPEQAVPNETYDV